MKPRPDTAWMAQAACRGVNAELFYPERGDTSTGTAAKAVCKGCTVRARCLDYALAQREIYGIWGGLSERQRRPLRRQRRTRPATCAVEGCETSPARRGWCRAHYTRWLRTGTPGGADLRRGRRSTTGNDAAA